MRHFNPRSREGSDVVRTVNRTIYQYFNPRSREGSDPLGEAVACAVPDISIHAPARGATQRLRDQVRASLISIHAPARGATRAEPLFPPVLHISIHAPARGATRAA